MFYSRIEDHMPRIAHIATYTNIQKLISDLDREMLDVTCFSTIPWWPVGNSFGLNVITGLPSGRLHRSYIKLRLRMHFKGTDADLFKKIIITDTSVRLLANPVKGPYYT